MSKKLERMILHIGWVIITLFHFSVKAADVHRLNYTNSVFENQYKRITSEIFQEDELFVLFYMDIALVVDPNVEKQTVIQIKTENPWESLRQYINNKSNIYFCPSERQLTTAIEYMPYPLDPSIMMADKFAMYRLSSPEQLFKEDWKIKRGKNYKAVVFGGLKYGKQKEPLDVVTTDQLAFRGETEGRGMVSNYSYLNSTYDEAIYIDSIFRKHKIEVALLTGENGTERNFNNISEHNVDIIHIASHGFYDSLRDNIQSTSIPEWMMSHSGLILSGATKGRSDDYIEDGVLTAHEISISNLSSVKLAVLSACDTGLGDIKENDLYGIIKGFKKAGAGTLLVSLSQVNDTVTGLLMKSFYDNIFRGDNPRRALENAQRYVRLRDNGRFNKISYWSSFILIDDIDSNLGYNVDEETKRMFLTEIIDVENLYSDFDLVPQWDELKDRLSSKDLIIRICPYVSNNSSDYVAYVGDVNGNSNVIRITSLKDGAINGTPLQSLTMQQMDSIIWQPLLPYIGNYKNLYCHFSGFFQGYPYESLPSVFEKFNIYRLSSFETLYKNNNSNYITEPNIALFGGLDYFEDESETNNQNKSFLTRDYAFASGFTYVPGTKQETDTIASYFYKYRPNSIRLIQGSQGNEDNFYKVISNKKLNILHLATHAISYTIGNQDRYNYTWHTIPSYLLDFNGIALSGANLAEDCYNHGCNNILTGSEISELDLSNLKLLVLSCCGSKNEVLQSFSIETPWNIVTAFKIAGVQTILFSLWDVEDESAATLMISFYRNLLNGNSIIASLSKAKLELRNNPKWSNPRYWAPYVLIDAF